MISSDPEKMPEVVNFIEPFTISPTDKVFFKFYA
jgi:hypothetical protein